MKVNKLVVAIILLFISFDLISTSFGLKILPLLFFLLILINEVLVNNTFIKLHDKKFSLLFLFMFIISIGLLKSGRSDVSMLYKGFKSITFILFVITFFTFIQNRIKNDLTKLFFRVVYLPLLIYVLINFTLFVIGFTQHTEDIIGVSVMLSYLGINYPRVQFPISIGINSYGSFLGILLTTSLLGFFVVKKYKKYFTLGIVLAFISLLLTDSRGPMVYSLLILLVVKLYYNRTKSPKFLWLIPILSFVGPLLLLAALAFVANFSIAESISRTSGDLATGNSRSIIWGIAISEFFSFDIQHHIFGYGEYGHYEAGLSKIWGPIVFGINNEAAKFMHPHNSLLSIALDYGYFGVLVFSVIQFKITSFIKRNWNRYREISVFVLGNLLYYSLVGIGETMIGFYYQNVLYLFFMINVFAFVVKDRTEIKLKKYENKITRA